MSDSQAVEQARRALGGELAAYRRAAGYSQTALASLVAYSRSTIANVETGRQHVPPDFRARADDVLHARGALTRANDGVEAAARREREQDAAAARRTRTEMARRWQVTAEGSRTAARPAPPADGPPAPVPDAAPPPGPDLPDQFELIELARRSDVSSLGSGTLNALWVAVDRLCRQYPTVPAQTLRDHARQYLRYVVGLLGGRTTLAEHRDLLVQAGWLALPSAHGRRSTYRLRRDRLTITPRLGWSRPTFCPARQSHLP